MLAVRKPSVRRKRRGERTMGRSGVECGGVGVMAARGGCGDGGGLSRVRSSPGWVLAGWLLAAMVLTGCGGGGDRPPAPRSAGLTPQLAAALERQFREQVTDSGIPGGASAAIVFPDGRVWAAAAGNAVIRPPTPMTVRTSISFDSVAKLATAALAMRLVEQGRLRLDDRIARWYPAWGGEPEATVRDLLGHTSGLGDPSERLFRRIIGNPDRFITAAEVLAATPRPGKRTQEAAYSNSGFVLAGTILARAAGGPVAAALRREVFDVPGGDGLAMQPWERPHPPLAHAYWFPEGGATPHDASDGGPYIPSRAWASGTRTAGALAGDVPSLARWGHAVLGGDVLQPRSLQAMTRFREGGPWEGYGLGVALSSVDALPMWGHGGDGIGTHTELWHIPARDVTIAVSWNDEQLEADAPFVQSLLRTVLKQR